MNILTAISFMSLLIGAGGCMNQTGAVQIHAVIMAQRKTIEREGGELNDRNYRNSRGSIGNAGKTGNYMDN